ncbi:bacteriocin immunity protein [Lacticaseibacillus zhaodongensis]|uniref:bacteriocin immunity protein n=1 Tax=Lacticaseibacillus zhaodongensis TaxID=2668065 RepID=UPI0012D2EBCF|nr:bacteriocin immunity protein [Lacticaseibacillus zhaodongensis]
MDAKASALLQQINAAQAAVNDQELAAILTRYAKQLQDGNAYRLVSLKLSGQLRHYLREHETVPAAVSELATTAHEAAATALGRNGQSSWYV